MQLAPSRRPPAQPRPIPPAPTRVNVETHLCFADSALLGRLRRLRGGIMRRAIYVIVLIAYLTLFHFACVRKNEAITSRFIDNFQRTDLGPNYRNTGGDYRILDGQLTIRGAHNHPLWLKKRLPRNAEIEFDVLSRSPEGDIKVEAWGDGESHATSKGAYLATSYVFILGGWGNQISALCRMDEHSDDRKTRKDIKVQPNRQYRFKIRRKGSHIEWFVDGKPFLSMDDPQPLEGKRHSYFGFNNWQSDLRFDNLSIQPL